MILRKKTPKKLSKGDFCCIIKNEDYLKQSHIVRSNKLTDRKRFTIDGSELFYVIKDNYLGNKDYMELIPMTNSHYGFLETVYYFINKKKSIIVSKNKLYLSSIDNFDKLSKVYGIRQTNMLIDTLKRICNKG